MTHDIFHMKLQYSFKYLDSDRFPFFCSVIQPTNIWKQTMRMWVHIGGDFLIKRLNKWYTITGAGLVSQK